jgi:hypothetical protein
MENLADKTDILAHQFIAILKSLPADAPRKWGKMDVQQMIEHMSDYVRIASGKTIMPPVTPEDKISKAQGFLMSEKPFPENTPNSLMPDEPPPYRLGSKEEAIAELQSEMDYFIDVYRQEPGKTTANPFFGQLNFDQQVQLLHKHGTHHLRQFGAIE